VTSGPPPGRGTRPANRRELILAAATGLFAGRGYEYVAMSEIAAAVAVRPSALYRHFAGKEQLLDEILRRGVAQLEAAVQAADLGGGAGGLADLAGFAIDHRDIGALTGRELPHLSGPSRDALVSALARVGHAMAGKVASVRPELSPPAADFLGRAALAVLASPAFQHAGLPRAEYCAAIAELTGRVISARLPDELTGERLPGNQGGLVAYSRREALLARAVELFAARSYAGVGIEDVAASLGMAGPSVYNHFRSKAEILVTALERGSACLSVQVAGTLATAAGPAPALRVLVASYARFAVQHAALIDLMMSEVRSLPEPQRAAAVTAQRDYVAELVHLLQQVSPELSRDAARVQVQAALTVANEVARAPHLRGQAGSALAAAAVGEQLLALSVAA
jgi:AcrR family transcriptional regulator